MSVELPQKIQARRRSARIAIVAARYNEKYMTALLENCLAELKEAYPLEEFPVYRVPGSYEVPVMVKRCIEKPEGGEAPEAVIALGVILRGSTAHADLVGHSVANKLLDIACDTLVPVVNEVLLLDDEQQAFARCVASTLNRGREAARVALQMLEDIDMQQGAVRRLSASAAGVLKNVEFNHAETETQA